uniref:Uncharacterized protein n=1 Tax=Panagrolaimus superbus TaxID=310955 RepID=A0A914YBT2_9BILA
MHIARRAVTCPEDHEVVVVTLVEQIVYRELGIPMLVHAVIGVQANQGIAAVGVFQRLAVAGRIRTASRPQITLAKPVHGGAGAQALQRTGELVHGAQTEGLAGNVGVDPLAFTVFSAGVAIRSKHIPVVGQCAA